jgi:energy-coupling factor transporter transmembrane protein EcfT
MKITSNQSFFDRRWIRIGFNLGLGIVLAVAICYTIVMVGVMGVISIFATAKFAGPGLFTSSILVVVGLCVIFLLFVVPAILGKTAAQLVNSLRSRTLPPPPVVPDKAAETSSRD